MTESPEYPHSNLPKLDGTCPRAVAQRAMDGDRRCPPPISLSPAVWAQQSAVPLTFPTQGLVWAHRLHLCNFRLWHVEDGVRRPGASERFIAQSKRAIDTFNQQRHEQIEQLDTWLFTLLYEHNPRRLTRTELHSETPGNLLDRLSILTLKVYYMGREAERQDATVVHRQTCRHRLARACRAARRSLLPVCAASVLISGQVGKR